MTRALYVISFAAGIAAVVAAIFEHPSSMWLAAAVPAIYVALVKGLDG